MEKRCLVKSQDNLKQFGLENAYFVYNIFGNHFTNDFHNDWRIIEMSYR